MKLSLVFLVAVLVAPVFRAQSAMSGHSGLREKWPDVPIEDTGVHSWKDWRVELTRDETKQEAVATVSVAGKRIWRQRTVRYWFGTYMKQADGAFRRGGVFEDLDHDGLPELILSSWSGGAHCCHDLILFAPGHSTQPQVLQLLDCDLPFIEMGKDATVLVASDFSYAYTWGSFAGSPAPEIRFRVAHGRFEFAPDLMATGPLDRKQIADRIAGLKHDHGFFPEQIIGIVLDAVYQGHEADAEWIVSEAGKHFPNMTPSWQDIRSEVARSPWGAKILRTRPIRTGTK